MEDRYKSQTAFLLDTLEYYCADPVNRRCSISHGFEINAGCYYSPFTINKQDQSEGCAIGRHLKPEDALTIDRSGKYTYNMLITSSFNKYAPKHLCELGSRFLSLVQNLHDGSINWAEVGLSMNGKKEVEYLILEFTLDKSIFEKYLV